MRIITHARTHARPRIRTRACAPSRTDVRARTHIASQAEDAEGAEAYRVASEKQKQLFKAACQVTRALNLRAFTSGGAGAARASFSDALAVLETHPLVSVWW